MSCYFLAALILWILAYGLSYLERHLIEMLTLLEVYVYLSLSSLISACPSPIPSTFSWYQYFAAKTFSLAAVR